MAVKVDTCCFCFNTKTGSIIFGCINVAISMINMILNVSSRNVLNIDVPYVLIGVGMLTFSIHLILGIMLIKGVKSREPKWIRIYIFYVIGMFLIELTSVIMEAEEIIDDYIAAVVVLAKEIYCLIVVYSEYKNILEEKEIEAMSQLQSMKKPL